MSSTTAIRNRDQPLTTVSTFPPVEWKASALLNMIEAMNLTIDPEIARSIPEPSAVLPSDEKKVNGPDVEQGWKSAEEWRNELLESIKADLAEDPNHKVQVFVWAGRDIIIDGFERFKICQQLGIDPDVHTIPAKDKAEAIRKRWLRNVTTERNLPAFVRAESIYRLWDKYFRPAKSKDAKANKGGRGKRAEEKIDQLKEMAKLARVSKATMTYVQRITRYAANPESKMPQANIKEQIRRLRNGTIGISTVNDNFIGFEERHSRKATNKGTSRIKSSKKPEGIHTKWNGELNQVITGDTIAILRQLPQDSIDRFVFSPPYYLADASADFHIHYGDEFEPFKSWDHYCNWTLRYLIEMWRILPIGGYIAVNIDNTREPSSIVVSSEEKNILRKPNPNGGRYYYHTDLIRTCMRDIDLFSHCSIEFENDPSLNPMLPTLGDTFRFDGSYYDKDHPILRYLKEHPTLRYLQEPWKLIDESGTLGFTNDGRSFGPRAIDVGEFVWAKNQVVAKRSATGSTNAPQRRPNHEYVLFWRKGEACQQASTMRLVDLQKGTISSWEDLEISDPFEEQIFSSYWQIASTPDMKDKDYRHPAPFPEKLALRMVEYGGSMTDTICDPFCGTGTTLYCAARRGRQYLGIELIPHFASRASRTAHAGMAAFQEEEFTKGNVNL